MIKSLFADGLGEVLEPGLGAADNSVTEAVSSVTGAFAAEAALILLDLSFEFVRLAAPPSQATEELCTSSAGSAEVPPATVTRQALTHFFEFRLILYPINYLVRI